MRGSGGVDGGDRALIHVGAACVCLLCRDQNPPAALSLPRPHQVPSLTLHPSPQHWQPPLRCVWTILTFAFGQGQWMGQAVVAVAELLCPREWGWGLLCLTGCGGQRWELSASRSWEGAAAAVGKCSN